MNLLDSFADAIPTFTGGIIAWAATTFAYRSKERTSRRREAADAIVLRLDELMRLVRKWDRDAGGARWLEVTEAALNAIEAETHRLPMSWRHLRRSVRAAIGEATGTMAFADRLVHDSNTAVPAPCPIWSTNAEEYFCYALARLRSWRDADPITARRVQPLHDFDVWLRERNSTPGLRELVRG
ncbi:hypothetical protein AB6N24_06170 [Cellulomonas sp. 179-A 4D5 NHS]|uniref:hypothetical protein n=1 Tax=Cellulomonas sp. 179-A 4D5 NHS TaxID=3142378 RepID=UPI0039A30DBA